MKRIFSLVLSIFIAMTFFFCSAQAKENELGLTYEQYQLPNGLLPLGVLGIHFLMHFSAHFYAGLVGYEAVSGNRGGYFGLGVDAGLQYPLYQSLWTDAGLRVGGAGGQNSPVGGGLFLQPYIGLKYCFPLFAAEVTYSYIDFPSGQISSDQIGLGFSFPLQTFSQHKHEKNYMAILVRNSFPESTTKDTAGKKDAAQFQSLGIEVGHFFTKTLFAFGNFVGALHGRLNGYAQSILGIGYAYPFTTSKKFSLIGKMGAGSAGGGAVDTGGGLMIEPSVGLEYRFIRTMGVECNVSYVNAINGSFSAKEANLLLKYYFDKNQSTDRFLKQWRIRILNQTYLNPRVNSGENNPNMQLLGIDIDYLIKKHYYATGQTAFAYSGRKTGGYFSGMLGIGVESSVVSSHFPVSIFSEILVGTAGGAGLDISSGALYEPVIGLNEAINAVVALQVSAGRLIAVRGHFNSTTINVGLTFLWA
ncbi:MAG: hypothetical protein COY58_00205 [Gammaproteobacteria bacterium CG_4_10_14_0_8_um_filter_38_16]|nr:MAG: hypothetical protein COY58_00205 [Gammaproteobacteria bacterium CG_4_10_14_0_8_um_filter_38_16]PJA02781.1 MAG: hypothetical protein COX72_08310 [Gammaproteobacteria bacterium CG_4_10_14_0_2_um_filter_38_22]